MPQTSFYLAPEQNRLLDEACGYTAEQRRLLRDRTIDLKLYLSPMSGDALRRLLGYTDEFHDHAPKLCDWLAGVVSDELERRMAIARDDRAGLDAIPEAEPVRIPAAVDWTAGDLADALFASTMFSFGIRDEDTGRIMDQIARAIVVFSSQKLRKLSP